MRILYITPYFYPVKGGAENVLFHIAKELVKKGHEVKVLTSDLDRDKRIQKKVETIEGIKIKRLKTYFKLGNFVAFFPSVFKEALNEDFDIVHIHGYRHPHNLLVFLIKKPKLITAHWPEYPIKIRGLILGIAAELFDLILGRAILNSCKFVCADTVPEAKWYQKKFNLSYNKIALVPLAIPNEYLKIRNPSIFRKKLEIRNNEIIVSSLSRLHKSKGLDLLIKAAKYFPDVKFIIAGANAGYEKELFNLISKLKLNNVTIIQNLNDEEKLQLLSSSDIFVHPSYYDAFGISILEAFSQNNAIIASHTGGVPWVVGNSGFTFKVGSVKDLKSKLEILINNKRLRLNLAEKGRKRVKNFIWGKAVENQEILYKKSIK
ncbi:glycosyltransferase family 4 protein [Candidatus Woesearchaeota archaeon]|nr:glycosyltransferase family 4 protein [Candidatus Woesearchaeota archaeon]